MDFSAVGSQRVSINCTVVELKPFRRGADMPTLWGINCTVVELKHGILKSCVSMVLMY